MQQVPDPLRMLIAGGGTGGHISPVIAVIDEIRNRSVPLKPLWVGSGHGFEATAANDLGIPFRAVYTGKLRRYVSVHTFFDAFRIPIGVAQATVIVRSYKPHVIFSTGGFVSVPSVVAGWIWKSPSLTHEQTASLGLATKINARLCDRTALSYAYSPKPVTGKNGSIVVTGNPVRSALTLQGANINTGLFDLANDRPLIYVTGGAQGAKGINSVVGESLPLLLRHVEIVHQCGPESRNHDFSRLLALRASLPQELARRYHPVETVGEELRSIYAAADLVISRAGAGTIAELASLGLPSILIPLPGANEQQRNADTLVDARAAMLVDENQINPNLLTNMVTDLISNQQRLTEMRAAAKNVAPAEKPSARLVDEIFDLARIGGWVQPDAVAVNDIRETFENDEVVSIDNR